MSQKGVWYRMQNIDRRLIYWILFIVLMIPFIRPLGLPVAIGDQARDLYNGLKQVKEGEAVVINISSGVSAWPECLPSLIASVKILAQQRAKIIVWTTFVDGQLTYEAIVNNVPLLKERTYGTDYVYLGYFAGQESGVAQLARDIRSVFTADYLGKPIDQLPIMNNVNRAQDIKMVLSSDTGDVCDYYIRQWRIPYGTLLAEIGIAMNFSAYQPFWKSGVLFGLSNGSRGGAEMEKLTGELGQATTTMDAINTSHLLVIAAIILANVGYLATRGKK